MWNWLKRKANEKPTQTRTQAVDLGLSESTKSQNSLRELCDQFAKKGYRGPIAAFCDGIIAVVFHGPHVPVNPQWIEASDNPFEMRVVDCREHCKDSFIYTLDQEGQSFVDNFRNRALNADQLCTAFDKANTTTCMLAYPKQPGHIPDGILFLPERMEDLWKIVWMGDYLYFLRSWTGAIRYRAKVSLFDTAMFVTEVQTNPREADLGEEDLASYQNESFSVRQVDFLIKAILLNLVSPAPLHPKLLPDTTAIASYSFSEYGRIGFYPTFDDTTEFRLCLNGTKGRFRPIADSFPLLNAVLAVSQNDNSHSRDQLYAALRKWNLLFPFTVAEDRAKHPISADTNLQFAMYRPNDQPCIYAYTDPTYRIEPSHGCMPIESRRLAEWLATFSESPSIVINPGGPATCRLEPKEALNLSH